MGLGLSVLLLAVTSVAGAQISAYRWQQYDQHIPTPYDEIRLAHHHVLGASIAAPVVYDEGYNTVIWNGTEWSDSGQPTPQRAAGMVYSGSAGTTLLYVPTESMMPGETYAWDNGWVLVDSGGPTTRDDCGIAYDSHRDRVVVYGGNYALEGPQPAYTWEFDGSAWHIIDTTAQGPDRRVNTAMAYDAARQEVVLFGGASDIGGDLTRYGDTWTWDGVTWQQVATTGPAPRVSHGMTYDPIRERVLLFGGATYQEQPPGTLGTNDLWEWDGQAWTEVTPPAPLPFYRYRGAMTWDTTRDQAVMSGGRARLPPRGDLIYTQDLWMLNIGDVWVDYGWTGAEDGSYTAPFNTLAEAQAVTPPRCIIRVKPGAGTENVLLNQPLFIQAPGGPVVITGTSE